MNARFLLSFRLLLGGFWIACFVVLGLISPPVSGADPSREEQIKALEKQIAELSQRLEALKKTPSVPEFRSSLPQDWVKAFNWRGLGPASMGGRIVAFAVNESDPTNFWIATASGGLLKTTNNGVTFEHQFDRESTVSIGDVAVAASNPSILWVGTGEHNPRNSVSYGDGVYKSTDGGKTWKNMGLKQSFQIGRILIHPKNPDIVYVGALGRLYGSNEERGLYKTTDGGKTWNRILHVDKHTGVIEMKMHPNNPETLLVATWERERDAFDSHAGALASQFSLNDTLNPPLAEGYDAYDPTKKWGKGGAIWKTTDGGKTFKKLTKGLPSSELGRVGLDFYRKNPNIVYAIIDCAKIGMGPIVGYLGIVTSDSQAEAKLESVTDGSPAATAGLKAGDIIKSLDKKPVKNGDDLTKLIRTKKPSDKIVLEIIRDKKSQTITVTLGERPEATSGGTRFIDFKSEEVTGGVRIAALSAQGPASQAGLQVGDVITSIGKEKVKDRKQVVDAIRNAANGSKLALTVTRGKDTKQITYTVAARAGQRRTARPYAFWYGGQRENVQDAQGVEGPEYGGVYRSEDGGETWKRINSVNPRPMYFSQIRVDPSDDKLIYVLGIQLYRSTDGGKVFRMGGDAGVHPDQHALWIDPRDGRHILIGTDGGTYVTYDRCQKWDYLNNASIGQFYHVCVDNRQPYRVYGGMQDNGSWGGPSISLDGRGPINSDWVMVQGGDGFVCRVDPNDPDIVYTESQEGNMGRTNLKTGERVSIKPRAPRGQKPYRFNWNAPMLLSSHNPRIFYCAGNFVFRSVTQGTDPRVISPEITSFDQASATALGESPRNPDVLWAGTDDGNLWVTRDGGKKWDNVAKKVGLPKPFYVATIEPSRTVEGRCYVCFDGHRSDNDDPHIYVTEDYGQTWKSLRANLPVGSSRCLREDLYNPDVLYLGTEFAIWASVDRGASWTKINNNLPTVAIHELAQHPTAGEMVAATHGRGMWVLDVTPLRQIKPAMAKSPATLLAPNTVVRWRRELTRGTIYGMGARDYFGENPQAGAHVYYALTKKASKAKLVVQDFAGKTIATLPVKTDPGMHRATWNLRGSPTQNGLDFLLPSRMFGAIGRAAAAAPAGQYRVVLSVDGTDLSQGLKLENDPTLPPQTTIADEAESRKPRRRADD